MSMTRISANLLSVRQLAVLSQTHSGNIKKKHRDDSPQWSDSER